MNEASDAVARLKAWLAAVPGRTQQDLARLARSSLPSVQRWLNQGVVPSYITLRRLEVELGIPLSAWPTTGGKPGRRSEGATS